MKLFGLPSGIALASLFWDLVFAKIVMEPLPLSVKVGLTYKVDWHSDKDYVRCGCVQPLPATRVYHN